MVTGIRHTAMLVLGFVLVGVNLLDKHKYFPPRIFRPTHPKLQPRSIMLFFSPCLVPALGRLSTYTPTMPIPVIQPG